MKLFCVIGNPINHSLSPLMHNAAIKNMGIKDSFYTKFCLPKNIDSKSFRNFIDNSHIIGANITLPFKEIAFSCVDEVKDLARVKAINTIVKKENKLIGYNTDVNGFLNAITSAFKGVPSNALVIGAGGSSKAIVESLKNVELTLINRSEEKLKYFQELNIKTMTINEFKNNHIKHYDVVINATSAGVDEFELPLEEKKLKDVFKNSKLVFDLMYKKNKLTSFCLVAKECNIPFMDGKEMLLHQGALSFLYFHDLDLKYLNEVTKHFRASIFN